MSKFKVAVTRGSSLLGAVGLLVGVGASAIPAFTSADALNPLTQRSLTLSSSSPGWSYTDGSGNSTYAPPNSGANGKQTGNYYSFKPSTTGSINALTFQYCTQAAGDCDAPGDDGNTGSTRNADTTSLSDLSITTTTPTEIPSATWTTLGGINGTTGMPANVPNPNDTQGNFVVLVDNGSGLTYSPDWTMSASNQEEGGTIAAGTATGKTNMMTLENVDNTGHGVTFTGADKIVVFFFGTDGNYITNPGAGAFFVKINDYEAPPQGSGPYTLNAADVNPISGSANVVDGGVTVANVMNQSIEIQTKVLETMQFSVGTIDPDTLKADNTTASELYAATGQKQHGQCDAVATNLGSGAQNLLYLGNQTAEHSLETGNTYGAHSYWRLSSNSSAGATVYYSGSTLHNTEGNSIAPINSASPGNMTTPLRGTPQFGLSIDNKPTGVDANEGVEYDNTANTDPGGARENFDYGADNATTMNGALDNVDATYSWTAVQSGLSAHNPQLFPLTPTANYGSAYGSAGNNGLFNPALGTVDAEYAFDPNANTVPVPIASESSQVVDCVTAKMRYVANIAATTPAGIYTTKINYIAAPQY